MNTDLIWNATPHSINIIRGAEFNSILRKYQGGECYYSIPATGNLLSANPVLEDLEPLVVDNQSIPVAKYSTGDVTIPNTNHTVIIVSVQYANAALAAGVDCSKLYTVSGLVVSDDGKTPIGCTGLIKFVP